MLERIFVVINIKRKKWLLCCSCNPHKNNISNHVHHLKGLDVFLKDYGNLLVLGDPNSELKDNCLNDFSTFNNLKRLNKETTRFENPDNPLLHRFVSYKLSKILPKCIHNVFL